MTDHIQTTIASYDATADEYVKKVDPLHPHGAGQKFLKLIHKEAQILDLGCCPGRDARIFTEKGFRVTGVDLSQKMIDLAQSRVPAAKFKVMDIRSLDFEDETFDNVWASACFLHIPKKEIEKALREVHRVMKADGNFYLSLKQGEGEILKPDDRYGGVEKFWSFFEKNEISQILQNIEFKILDFIIEKHKEQYHTNSWMHIYCQKL